MSNKIVFEHSMEYGDKIRKNGSGIRFDTVGGV